MATTPIIHATFHRNLSGDDALLRLFQAKFEAAGLGAEIYPGDLAEALHTWRFVPGSPSRHMVHLPRHWDVFAQDDRRHLLDMAHALDGRARGLVLHDGGDWFTRRGELMAALGELDEGLSQCGDPVMLFVEYAAGLELDQFAQLIEAAASLSRVSACIDTGHVTVFTARAVLRRLAPEVNTEDPATLERIPPERLMSAVETAQEQARASLVALARRLARLAKPLHVHLHDGHLFSRWSIFHVSDHAPIGWDAASSGHGPSLLGAKGVADFLRALLVGDQLGRTSITIEVHPGRGQARQPLGPHAPLFAHWSDLSHAEMTHAWIDLMLAQHRLVRGIAERIAGGSRAG